jgi:dTDP-4-amino-4,6-dideoxygalactose transaminase
MNMNIPFVDLKIQYHRYKKPIDHAISDVVENSRFIQGREVAQFENEFARYLHAKYCIGVNSGTDALILGIRALGLKQGDEVIVPVNTFIATALGVSENGLKPVFVDCDTNDYGMDLTDLKKKITSKTKAVIAVHLYGRPEKIDEIKKIIRQSGRSIYFIEDACQAHGALYLPRGKTGKGKRVGTFGIFSAFSFYPGKNLGAYGDGGAIVTDNEVFAGKCRMLREYGQKKKYIHTSMGINSRLDTIQAAVLRVKLKHLDRWNIKRQKIASYYTKRIRELLPSIKTQTEIKGRQSVFHLYIIEADKRDKLLKTLNGENIQTLIHYPIPLHLQGAYNYLGYKKGDFPNAEYIADHILSLPIYPELTKKQVNYIVHTIKTFYEK